MAMFYTMITTMLMLLLDMINPRKDALVWARKDLFNEVMMELLLNLNQ